MKLTGELKDKVDAVDTLEEKKAILENAGVELSDDILEEVTGGIRRRCETDYKEKRLPRFQKEM